LLLQIPIPSSITLRGIYFINFDTGYAVGGFGTIARTTNGGQTWDVTNLLYSLYGIDFEDSDTGYICGAEGHIFKIPSGEITIIDTLIDLFSINFPVPRVGWTVGSNGSIYKTSDGGAAIEEINKREMHPIFISPNPFLDYLTIKTISDEKVRLKIYDKTGNLVLEKEKKGRFLRLNCRSFPKGVYLIEVNGRIIKVVKI
jgi:photosystem II stability/assembly factor-like uncharacterized protein